MSTPKAKIPRVLDAYLMDGPASRWLRFQQTMYVGICIFIGALCMHFLAMSGWVMIAGAVGGYLTMQIFGMIIVFFMPWRVRAADLVMQLENSVMSRKELEKPGTNYVLADLVKNIRDPSTIEADEEYDEDEIEAVVDLYSLTFRKYADIFTGETDISPARKAECLEYMRRIVKKVASLRNEELNEWQPHRTIGTEFEITFNNGERFICPTGIYGISMESGEVKTFDLIPTWDGDKILSGKEVAAKVKAMEKVGKTVLMVYTPFAFFEGDNPEPITESIPSYFVLKEDQ